MLQKRSQSVKIKSKPFSGLLLSGRKKIDISCFVQKFLIALSNPLNWIYLSILNIPTFVVYCDQCLGAAHSKRWSKWSFSAFFVLKSKKFAAKFCKKHVFLSLHQNTARRFYSQKNGVRSTQMLVEIYNKLLKIMHKTQLKTLTRHSDMRLFWNIIVFLLSLPHFLEKNEIDYPSAAKKCV